MSGLFKDGKWYENTGRICKRCERPVWESDTKDYAFQCFHCDEDLYEIETVEKERSPKIVIARHFAGITINNTLEYILDDNGEVKVFDNLAVAKTFLFEVGLEEEGLQFLYFIEVE